MPGMRRGWTKVVAVGWSEPVQPVQLDWLVARGLPGLQAVAVAVAADLAVAADRV
ncbi:hypothetical protein D3C86_1458790 [compost metagenome]